METGEILAATDGMEVDDLADLIADLPEAMTRQVLALHGPTGPGKT